MAGTIEPLDLNHLRVFERVAAGRFFPLRLAHWACRNPMSAALSSSSKLHWACAYFSVTTRNVVLTAAGEALRDRCAPLLGRIDETVEYVSSLAGEPRGNIKISAGIGFGVNVLSELLPSFIDRYPEIRVTLDLSTRLTHMISEGVDCAIRFGPLPDSSLVSTQLGATRRYLCASPSYLAKRGSPIFGPRPR